MFPVSAHFPTRHTVKASRTNRRRTDCTHPNSPNTQQLPAQPQSCLCLPESLSPGLLAWKFAGHKESSGNTGREDGKADLIFLVSKRHPAYLLGRVSSFFTDEDCPNSSLPSNKYISNIILSPIFCDLYPLVHLFLHSRGQYPSPLFIQCPRPDYWNSYSAGLLL